MSNLIRCDWCQKELVENCCAYFRLERDGLDLSRLDEQPGPWHFDTWECAFKFTMAKAANEHEWTLDEP